MAETCLICGAINTDDTDAHTTKCHAKYEAVIRDAAQRIGRTKLSLADLAAAIGASKREVTLRIARYRNMPVVVHFEQQRRGISPAAGDTGAER